MLSLKRGHLSSLTTLIFALPMQGCAPWTSVTTSYRPFQQELQAPRSWGSFPLAATVL